MEYFNLLPDEIRLDIISRVPTESVLECKLVSTIWRSIVRHPSFSKLHFHHLSHPAANSGKLGFIAVTYPVGRSNFNLQYFEYDENRESIEKIRKVNLKSPFGGGISFLGSSNGLICLTDETETYICNPITREYIMIPQIKTFTVNIVVMTGFGYVASTSEYKVVTILSKFECMEVHVYTLGSGYGWRNVGKFNLGRIEYWEQGLYFNGSFYWLDSHLRKIATFNLSEEKFSDLSPPPSPSENGDSGDYYQLRVLDGCLSFAIYGRIMGAEYWDVWLLENKDDNHCVKEREGHQSMGWRKEFRVFDSEEFRLSYSESGSVEGRRLSYSE